MLKKFGLWGPAPWVAAVSTPKIFSLVMIGHSAKFSNSSYMGWSVEIAGMKNRGTKGPSSQGHS